MYYTAYRRLYACIARARENGGLGTGCIGVRGETRKVLGQVVSG